MRFDELRIGLDPWRAEYGDEILAEAPGAEADEGVEVEVETDVEAAEAWRPILPRDARAPERLVFVDGVRRVEARVLARRPEGLAYGVFASCAVGWVESDPGGARFGPDRRVERYLILGAGLPLDERIEVTPSLVFEPASTDDDRPEAPALEIQSRMQRAEAELVRELATDGAALVLADGPLRFEQSVPRRRTLGYVKRFVKLYLPASYLDVLERIPAGGRTPIFRLRRGGFGRFSWYLRLAPPSPGESPLAGLARLEISDDVAVDDARDLADATCAALPRFAPRPWYDPRAPQNLTPIAALERELKRALGDRQLVRRHIETLLARTRNHG